MRIFLWFMMGYETDSYRIELRALLTGLMDLQERAKELQADLDKWKRRFDICYDKIDDALDTEKGDDIIA